MPSRVGFTGQVNDDGTHHARAVGEEMSPILESVFIGRSHARVGFIDQASVSNTDDRARYAIACAN